MKQLLFWLLCVPILLGLQPNVDHTAIYNRLQSIHNIHTFQAHFIYTSKAANEAQTEVTEATSGEIWVTNHKYHLILDQQEIICNGQLIWNYLPIAQEAQITEYDPEQELLDPIKLLTLYHTGFIPVSLQEKLINGHSCDAIELVAEDPDTAIRKMILTIDQKEQKIKQLEALDADQYWHIFQITKFEPKEALPDYFFEFDVKKYPAIELIDLR